MPMTPREAREVTWVAIALSAISIALALIILALLWAFDTLPPKPQDTPVIHVFTSDLTIHSPHPLTTPGDINDWLHQVSAPAA